MKKQLSHEQIGSEELRQQIDHHAAKFAKAGYLARACVYFLMGGFALLVAFHNPNGAATDTKGALTRILYHPGGSVFLFALALGLFSYAFWRLYQAIKDKSGKGKSARGLTVRAGYVLGAITHFSLGLYALNLVFFFSKMSNRSEQMAAHKLLLLPFGRWITGLVGLGIVAFGLGQFVIAIKEKFMRKMEIPRDKCDVVVPLCKFGLMSRGAVFAMIGSFFVQAALRYSSKEAGGIAQAWGVLRAQPYGNMLLAIVAAGFMAFGVYGVTEALYERTA